MQVKSTEAVVGGTGVNYEEVEEIVLLWLL